MAEALPLPTTLYSIVVVGAMNPRIHHPLWYRGIEAVSEGEVQAAIASPSLIVMPTHAQVDFEGFTIICQDVRWEIRTADAALRPRILDVAERVFQRLNETPVSLFGLNTKRHLVTSVPDVKERLADLVLRLGLGFSEGGAKSCGVTFSNRYETRSVNVEVSPSPLAENMVFVGYNTEYRSTVPGYFDLGALVREHFDVDYQSANDAQSRVVAGING